MNFLKLWSRVLSSQAILGIGLALTFKTAALVASLIAQRQQRQEKRSY